MHQMLIQSLSFSNDEQYLASLGGQDDGQLVIWESETGKPICGHSVGMHVANKICFYNNTANNFVTIHDYGIRIWDVDYVQKKILYQDL